MHKATALASVGGYKQTLTMFSGELLICPLNINKI